MTAAGFGEGSWLGSYRLIKRMAAGGLGDIFLAHRGRGGQYDGTFVVKVPRWELLEDDEAIDHFSREREVANVLVHPNIVQTLEAGQSEGRDFLVLEFVFGRSLQRVLERCSLQGEQVPIEVVRLVGADVLAALAHAHSIPRDLGGPLVHRDVSPSNILLGFDGTVRVLDFGLAKASMGRALTRAGVIKGQFGYMSPEQVWQRPLDGRSDLFSVGIVLWECLAGRSLFGGVVELEAARRICTRRVEFLGWELPWGAWPMARLVHRSLERDAPRRPRSAMEMRRSLLGSNGWNEPKAREELAEWLRTLYRQEFATRESALRRWTGDPLRFRQISDAGFELLPEVTDPALARTTVPRETRSAGPARRRQRRRLTGLALPLLAILGAALAAVRIAGTHNPDAQSSLSVAADTAGTVTINGEQRGDLPIDRLRLVPLREYDVEFSSRNRFERLRLVLRPGENRLVYFKALRDRSTEPGVVPIVDDSTPAAPP